MVGLLGVPYDDSSSFMKGPALGPDRVRQALASPSWNPFSEAGVEIVGASGLRDLGDVTIGAGSPREDIEARVALALDDGLRVLALGGDHSITYPILRAYHARYPELTIVQFDAHADLYDTFEGDRYSHACPFARIMEEGLVGRLIQIGIRTLTPHLREQVRRFGVEVIEMPDLARAMSLELTTPVYVSFDLDGLDPAFASGVSHHEPGGMSTRQAIDIIHAIDAPIVGADVVELNPRRDPLGITAMVAARLVKELAANMLTRELG